MRVSSSLFLAAAVVSLGACGATKQPPLAQPQIVGNWSPELTHSLALGYWKAGPGQLTPQDRLDLVLGTATALTHTVSGTEIAWVAPSGTRLSVSPRTRYTDATGNLCRAFVQTAELQGGAHEAKGIACLKPGSERWELRF